MNLEFFIRLRDMASNGLAKMARTAQKTNKQMRGANGALSQSYDHIQRKVQDLESTIRKSTSIKHIRTARKELRELSRMQRRHPGNMSRGGGWLGGMMRQAMPVMGIAGAMMLGGGTVNAALEHDRQTKAINFATDGRGQQAEQGVRQINDLYGMNNRAGLEGFKTLSGSLRSLNTPLKEQLRIYKSVSAAAGAMQLTGEQAKGTYLALGQIASKGTVSAEELRGQIGERIPGAFGIAAEAMGVTTGELDDMLRKGEVASKDFLPKFATQLQKTFGQGALDNAEGPAAVAERFNNKLRDIQITIGQVLLPVLTQLKLWFVESVDWIQDHSEELTALAVTVAWGATVFGAYKLVTSAAAIQTGVLTAKTWLLNSAFLANPIVGVIALLGGLAVGVVYAWNKFDSFRGAIVGLWEVFKQVFTNIGDFFKKIFSPIFEAIEAFKSGRYMDVGKAVAKMAYNLSPVGMTHRAVEFAAGGGFTKDVGLAWEAGQERGKNMGPIELPDFLSIGNKSTNPSEATDGTVADAYAGTPGGKGNNGTSTSNNDTVKGITSGGPRQIIFNVDKIVEGGINITSEKFEKGLDGAVESAEDALLRLLNSGAKVQG